MSGVISSNLEQRWRLYLKPFFWGLQTRHTHRQTDRHTHTHDDSIRRNAMRCISHKNYKYRNILGSIQATGFLNPCQTDIHGRLWPRRHTTKRYGVLIKSNVFSIRCMGYNKSYFPEKLLSFPSFSSGVENAFSRKLFNWFKFVLRIIINVLEVHKNVRYEWKLEQN